MKYHWKRNIVVMTVLFFVCVAVYLNWKYTDSVLPGDAEQDAVTDVTVNTESSGSTYFATARLSRQQARDNALALLQEAAADENADQETINGVAEHIQVLANYTMVEAQIENLVTAKGYVDCVAFMADNGISIVVETETGELTQADVAKISDIVKAETNYRLEQIKIMEANS